LTIVPLEAHELLHWKLIDGISCRRPPYSNATRDVKVQHLGTSLSRNHLQVLHEVNALLDCQDLSDHTVGYVFRQDRFQEN
jgi:hypothetical protein